MAQKSIKVKTVSLDGVELDLNGPDFSKLNSEHSLPEPDAYQRAKHDEDVRALYRDGTDISGVTGGGI
jgi:hypothetical protein